MSVSVPEQRIDLVYGDVGVSDPVRAVSWVSAARLHNWVAGRPITVVPCFRPGLGDNQNDSSNYYFRFAPRYQDVRYVLRLRLSAESTTTRSGCSVTVPVGGTSYNVTAQPRAFGDPAEHEFPINLASQGTSEIDLSFTLAETSDSGRVRIEACSIEAVPRVFLVDDSSDLGLDRLRFNHRAPITADDLGKLLARQNELLAAARRAGQWHHAFGSLDAYSTTSTTFVNPFGAAGGPNMGLLGRALYNGDTTRTFGWTVRGYCSTGATSGQVQISNTSGGAALDSIDIPTSTTSAAFMASSTFTADVEDNAEADGIPSSTWDDHTIEIKRTAGAGTVYLESISIWEA